MTLWFRSYPEALNDPKVQTLSLASYKAWHNALYLAGFLSSNDGNIGTIEAVSFAFRETKESVSSAFHELLERGLIVTVGETFQIAAWKKRQFKSDTSTERVRKYRAKKERFGNVTETAPDTESDTDTDTEKRTTNVVPKRRARAPLVSCPDDVSAQVWDDFVKHRAAKKAAITETAIKGLRREADKAGWSLEDALAESVMRGWTGFDAKWIKEGNAHEGNRGSSKPSGRAQDGAIIAINRKRALGTSFGNPRGDDSGAGDLYREHVATGVRDIF